MSKRDLYDKNGQSAPNVPSSSDAHEALNDLFGSLEPDQFEFEDDENAYYNTRTHASSVSEAASTDGSDFSAPQVILEDPADEAAEDQQTVDGDGSEQSEDDSGTASPGLHLEDFTDYDTYSDSGVYRSYDGSSEYRSFDAAMPDAPEEGWYHFSQEDSDLEEHADDNYDPDEDDDAPLPRSRHRKLLSVLSHVLLILVTLLCGFYLMVLYSGIPQLTNLRDMYIRTAMTTLSHKWLATSIIPSDIIDKVMLEDYEADVSMVGVSTNWGNVDVQALPTFTSETREVQDTTQDTPQEASLPTEQEETVSQDEQTFFQMFYEVDQTSLRRYLDDHPEALEDGWSGIDINEAGLDDDGTDIKTVHGDQVLALDAVNGILLVRVELGSSRGVMAICKDTSRLSLCAASTLPATGQTAGKICDDHDGILAINGSAFLDDGTSNGGQISGLAICQGSEMGYRLGGVGDKRLELRDDNRMYIVDSYADVGSGTRDACEFRPALIVDGENLSRNSTWTSPNPRAVLGQSDRLETMMVIVEGRLLDSPGCSVVDIADKMEEYGCVQALNLDGGTSAIMYYKGEYITRCSNTALPGGRTLPSAWVYK